MTNTSAPQYQRGRKKEENPAELTQVTGLTVKHIRAMDALAHSILAKAGAETAPAAQRGAGTEGGDAKETSSQGGGRLMSADVRAPSSLRPGGGRGSYGGSAAKPAGNL